MCECIIQLSSFKKCVDSENFSEVSLTVTYYITYIYIYIYKRTDCAENSNETRRRVSQGTGLQNHRHSYCTTLVGNSFQQSRLTVHQEVLRELTRHAMVIGKVGSAALGQRIEENVVNEAGNTVNVTAVTLFVHVRIQFPPNQIVLIVHVAVTDVRSHSTCYVA